MTILETAEQLGYQVVPSYQMGSDHAVFAQAGIVATNIAIVGNQHHSPNDTPENVNTDSLVKAGRIIAEVVWRTMKKL